MTCSQLTCSFNWQSAAPVSQSSNRIPYKPKFFSGFVFATAKVVYITANVLHIIDNDNNKNNDKDKDNDKDNNKDSLQIERLT